MFLVQCGGFLVLALALFHGLNLWQASRLAANKTSLVTYENDLAQQVVTLAAQYPDKQYPNDSKDPNYQLSATLDGLTKNNSVGFSDYMLAMATKARRELWLTKITILQGGAGIKLEGAAESPLVVSKFVNDLKKEPSFSNKEFDVLRVTKAKKKGGVVHFVASTVSMR